MKRPEQVKAKKAGTTKIRKPENSEKIKIISDEKLSYVTRQLQNNA